MTLDEMKLSRDGHLWAARYVKPEYPKVIERRPNGHTLVALCPDSCVIEYARRDCQCGDCGRKA